MSVKSKNLSLFNKLGWMKVGVVGLATSMITTTAIADVYRTKKNFNGGYIKLEVLDDDLVHVEYGTGSGPSADSDIQTTPMIFKKDYAGPTSLSDSGSDIETAELVLNINSNDGCMEVFDKSKGFNITKFCPDTINENWKKLSFQKNTLNQVYGLGQKLTDVRNSDANGDWVRRGGFDTNGDYGHIFNGITMDDGSYAGGASSKLQFPIMYASGTRGENIAVLWDSPYKGNWTLSGDWWNAGGWGQIRFYVLTGDSMVDLRRDYMELTGTAPVPPKKAFGLWVSEFGYESWNEVDETLSDLRNENFPVDGFVLDLQWFGGYEANSGNTPMGSLTWDEWNFPNPDNKIASFKNDHIGLITIEESYVGSNLSSYHEMNNRGWLINYCGSSNTVIFDDWVGHVGAVDWTNPDGTNWWHDNRRKPNIIDKGIIGHWTDLGEPEKYNGDACYAGVNGDHSHGAAHNLYNWHWTKSIYDGYVRHHNQNQQRPFQLTRAGTIGTHRFGAAMWSGDIGGRLDNMAASLNAQMHMSFAGIDYYGSDIGGFWRVTTQDDTNTATGGRSEGEMYTLWFANSAWFDIPVRPHGIAYPGFTIASECPDQCNNETSPAKVGNINSNLLNIRQRYELTPFYYSLGHNAYLTGEPVIAPLVMYYQNDDTVRGMGNQKLIGKDIMVKMVYRQFEPDADVYLPEGTWIDYHNSTSWTDSSGQWLNGVQVWSSPQNRNILPAYVRAGAIIPKMHVDDQTKDVFGNRRDGSERDELIVQVYADGQASSFTLYEDDGKNVENYDNNGRPSYQTRTTLLEQQHFGEQVNVTINAAEGFFDGQDDTRNNELRLVYRGFTVNTVMLNGESLPQLTHGQFYATPDTKGFYIDNANEVRVRTGQMSVYDAKEIVVAESISPQPPVAQAGNDIVVNAGVAVVFDGTASTDPNNDIVSYTWTSTAFNTPLSGATPSFTFSQFGDVVVTLTVRDAEGLTDTDTLTVTVEDPNAPKPPVANAGSDISGNINETISFNGAASTDPNGDIASYEWTSTAFTTPLSGVAPTFVFSQAGDVVVTLTVTDATGLTSTDTLTVSLIDPNACDYQFNQMHFRGTANSWSATPMTQVGNCEWETVQTFSGSSQDRFKFDVSTNWSHNYGDDGANGSLERSGDDIFLNRSAGDYIIRMNDKTMTYSVTLKPQGPQAPVANAGGDVSVKVGEQGTLSGAASSDADGTITDYQWKNHLGSVVGLSQDLTITFHTLGTYTFTLTVTDNDGMTDTDTVVVTVNEDTPDTNWGSLHFRGTPNNWSATAMNLVDDYTWRTQMTFAGGSTERFKVDVNGDWGHNYGDDGANGSLERGGDDIFVPEAGDYIITVNEQTLAYTVEKIVGNQAPVANAGDDVRVVFNDGQSVTLDGSASFDPDGTIVSYLWVELGQTGPTAFISRPAFGEFTYTLRVTDNEGATSTDTVVVTALENQAPVAVLDVLTVPALVGEPVSFSAANSSDADGSIFLYRWFTDQSESFGETMTHTYDEAGTYGVEMRVTDNLGAMHSVSVVIEVIDAPTTVATTFTCHNGNTVNGQSVYIVGDQPELGPWSVQSAAQKLDPNGWPTWSGVIDLPANTAVKWKCVIADEQTLQIIRWEGGSDNTLNTGSGATASSTGSF